MLSGEVGDVAALWVGQIELDWYEVRTRRDSLQPTSQGTPDLDTELADFHDLGGYRQS